MERKIPKIKPFSEDILADLLESDTNIFDLDCNDLDQIIKREERCYD